MSGEPTSKELTRVKRGMMSAVHYFDIFKHPLSVSELRSYMHGVAAESNDFEQALQQLINSGQLHIHDGYLLLHNRIENITRRKNGEAETKKLWPEAEKKISPDREIPLCGCGFPVGINVERIYG